LPTSSREATKVTKTEPQRSLRSRSLVFVVFSVACTTVRSVANTA
jgi:hypothetical protein